MTEKPIIFSAPMVKALLDGRKTMTRRVLKPMRGVKIADCVSTGRKIGIGELLEVPREKLAVPYTVGDLLWVREMVACGACAPNTPSHWSPGFWRAHQGTPSNPNGLWYAADGLAPEKPITTRGRWVPSIHMPRWASRITLRVTGVRVQRLQEISEEDARAEGCPGRIGPNPDFPDEWDPSPTEEFRNLWASLHGPGSWQANPWCCAVAFERLK